MIIGAFEPFIINLDISENQNKDFCLNCFET